MTTVRSTTVAAVLITAAALTTGPGTATAAPTAPTAPTAPAAGSTVVRQAATASLVAHGSTAQQASHRLDVQRANGARGSALAGALGDRAAGSYLDADGGAVVTVLDDAAARQVRAAGLTARVVPNSAAALTSVQHSLDRLTAVPNSSWGVDPVTDRVEVTVSDATPAADAARLRAAVAAAHGLAHLVTVPGALRESSYDGGPITHDGIRCSSGFNSYAYDGSGYYTVTAGHCTKDFPTWDIGPTVASNFPGTDFGLIQNTVGAPSQVRLYDGAGTVAPITASGNPYVGEQFCKSGSTTGLTCGQVTELGRTVTYEGGNTIYGLMVANTTSGHGDSGGAAFDGQTGIAMVSGGNGSGQVFFYQPLQPALDAYGLTVSY